MRRLAISGFELNKFIGAVLLTLLTIQVIGTIGDALVQPKRVGKSSVGVVVAEKKGSPKAEGVLDTVLPLLAAANIEKGIAAAKKCAACHTFEQGGANKIGPNLWNVVNAELAKVEGFKYSDALQKKGGKWGYEALNAFLARPKKYLPGTKMAFAGVKSVGERADLIAYLRSLSGSPVALPSETEIAAAKAAVEEQKTKNTAAASPKPRSATAAPKPAGSNKASAAQTISALLADAKPQDGEKVAKKCTACHTFTKGGSNKIGPNLWNIVNAERARVADFKYSDAAKKNPGKWTYEHLDAFLTNPKKFMPGTKMVFVGIKKPGDRADLILYLRSLSENPAELP